MRVLMFGWEFPPHISGGLGTACYGLTRGLVTLEDTEVLFVVPKAFGDEEQNLIKLIGANKIPITRKELKWKNIEHKIDYLEAYSQIVPYVTEEEFWNLKSKRINKGVRFIRTDKGMNIDFSGTYGLNLIEEIKNYSIIAEVIALENEFDVIHAHDWLAYPAGMAAKKFQENLWSYMFMPLISTEAAGM
jgi:glycogen synthase